jgi:transaldolase
MKKVGITDYVAFSKDILALIKDKPLSLEVFADDFQEMRRQALEINSWGKNVYVKIPVTNSEGKPSYELVQDLTQKGVKLNVTAILTTKQVTETCLALKGGASAIVSVFAGRVADTGRDPSALMIASRDICRKVGSQIELLWASTREVLNIVQAEEAGCDIITVPFDILRKMDMINQDLTELSLDTVKMFKRDAESAGYKI